MPNESLKVVEGQQCVTTGVWCNFSAQFNDDVHWHDEGKQQLGK